MTEPISNRSVPKSVLLAMTKPVVRRAGLRCAIAATTDFFLLQFRAVLSPGSVPVSAVDHPLDKRVPFEPKRVDVYLDFVPFWIRAMGFLLDRYGRGGAAETASYVEGMERLYRTAARVYRKNLSTTDRPRYLARPRFLLIHLSDPHLLCVPSLHVMIVVRAYTHFRAIVRAHGDEEILASRIDELRRGALRITETVLFVKQHSVNCVPAALYTMTQFDPKLFSKDEAEKFIADLFRDTRRPSGADADAIREHILNLYQRFLREGQASEDWRSPILTFLGSCPLV